MTQLGRLSLLWRVSGPITSGRGAPRLIRRIRYARDALGSSDALSLLLDAPPKSLLGRTVAGRPELLRFVQAPYINAAWDADTRIRTVVRHIDMLDRLGSSFGFDIEESLELLPLDMLGPDYHVVLDKPIWFHREGVLALNLFKSNLRLFSIAFAIDDAGGSPTMLIGGIQGRSLPNALDEYRELTRLAHGLRPRDLLIELLRMLARAIGATRMLAISDALRQHRSRYFGPDTDRVLPLNYDDIWRDRGGVEAADGFFALPVERQSRSEEEIPAKKRQMYRRRYELLDALEQTLSSRLAEARPVVRPQAD